MFLRMRGMGFQGPVSRPLQHATPILNLNTVATRPRYLLSLTVRASNQSTDVTQRPQSAKEAVETGLVLFNEKKKYAEAVQMFNAALDLQPSEDEAMAALYNLGCAYSKQKQWKSAADAIVLAINSYRLKLSVALKDDDLRELRERREWIDALTQVKGGLSRDMKIEMRSEAKAPFRFTRTFLFSGLALGSGLGLFIITSRLVLAVQGGVDAPDLNESLQNFAINASVLAGVVFLLVREAQSKQKAIALSDREEGLSRLQVDMGKGRVLPLLRFRGTMRPVILAGSKVFVDRALKTAESYITKLRERGVSVIPLVLADEPGQVPELDPDAKILALKREFQRKEPNTKGFGTVDGVKKAAVDAPEDSSGIEGVIEADLKWKLEAFDPAEWKAWVLQQKGFANLVGEKQDCFIQVQLDGTVRSSALGPPNWGKFVDDLPPVGDIRTMLSDGVGTSV